MYSIFKKKLKFIILPWIWIRMQIGQNSVKELILIVTGKYITLDAGHDTYCHLDWQAGTIIMKALNWNLGFFMI